MNSVAAYKEFEHFLRLIYRSKEGVIPYLLRSADSKVIRSIIEIAYNLLKGDIPLTINQKKHLKKDKKIIKFIISKTNSLEKKRTVMCENPKLVKSMLRIVF